MWTGSSPPSAILPFTKIYLFKSSHKTTLSNGASTAERSISGIKILVAKFLPIFVQKSRQVFLFK